MQGETNNVLSITDHNDYVVVFISILECSHNDSFELKLNLNIAFQEMKTSGLCIQGAYFNAGSSFDTKEGCKTYFNHGVIPNIIENRRNRNRLSHLPYPTSPALSTLTISSSAGSTHWMNAGWINTGSMS